MYEHVPSCAHAKLTLTNTLGLHARAAAAIVQALQGLQAEVSVGWAGHTANARSILELLTLGAPQGSVLEVSANGPDAEAAVTALTRLIENRFYEE
ncbi:MAG: HPr family phosphocarrier protein [Candidatus Binatia bacterium]|nr:HPr family phosphocarrier protein [Candidatus Binatia bacterium]